MFLARAREEPVDGVEPAGVTDDRQSSTRPRSLRGQRS
jgi:hypothetical protein